MTSNHTPLSSAVTVHVFGRTDVGRTREHNEDAFVVCDLETGNATLQPEVRTHVQGARGTLFMVADGMGGAAAGELASAMATDVVLSELDARWRRAAGTSAETFVIALKAATEAANARIHRFAIEHPENRGMGTTATIAGLLGDQLYLAQVGDSRAYLVRDGVAVQITKDQSLMQKLIEAGELTEEEAEVSERRNIILQAIGPEPTVKVDLTQQQLRRGDVLLLCSDGLSGQMHATDIATIATDSTDLVQLCKRLIDLANENGGPDNITVIAARADGATLLAPAAGDTIGYRPYVSESEMRPTVRVSADDITALADDADLNEHASGSAVSGELRPTRPTRPTPVLTAAQSADLAAAPTMDTNATPPRVSRETWRIIFGLIALGVIAWQLYRYLR